MKPKILLPISLVALLAVILGSVRAAEGCRAKIPFQFTVERTSLPAGEYDFVPSPDNGTIRVTTAGKGKSGAADALVVTRLAQGIHTTSQDAHIVFDKVGEIYILSELWFPGFDGYLVHSTKEKHEHKIINVPS